VVEAAVEAVQAHLDTHQGTVKLAQTTQVAEVVAVQDHPQVKTVMADLAAQV
jgi:hypothetical protein